MKKYFFLWIAAGLMISGLQAQNTQRLVVHRTAGEAVVFDLEEEPVTTFGENALVITTTQTQISFPLDEVSKFTYEGIAEAIDAVEASALHIRQTSERIEIDGLSNNALVELYTVDGRLMTSTRAEEAKTTMVSLTAFPAGTYIINAGGTSYKFLKQ